MTGEHPSGLSPVIHDVEWSEKKERGGGGRVAGGCAMKRNGSGENYRSQASPAAAVCEVSAQTQPACVSKRSGKDCSLPLL